MIIYVSHFFKNNLENLERARQITHDLQVADLENTYICPLFALSHLRNSELSYEQQIEARIDLLSVCDKMIVASDLSKSVCKEIDFCNLVGMEVQYLEDAE